MDSLEKERERKGIQYDIFSSFLARLSETGELPVDFNEKRFHRLVDYATVYLDAIFCAWKKAADQSGNQQRIEV